MCSLSSDFLSRNYGAFRSTAMHSGVEALAIKRVGHDRETTLNYLLFGGSSFSKKGILFVLSSHLFGYSLDA